MTLDPHTPVIVGVAQQGHRLTDPADAVEPIQMMIDLTRAAAADAGSASLLERLDAVAVVNGAWRYPDPGRIIAGAVGSPDATTMLSYDGGNTPQSFLNDLANRIQAGELNAVALTGAETIWSRRRRKKLGLPSNAPLQAAAMAEEPPAEPDERFAGDIPMSTDFEQQRGLSAPINYYPIFESAIRYANGETIDAHRTRIAELWVGFNQAAVANPHAWSREPMTASEIREPSPDNRMVGFPYTKAMNSNWDLDQGTSIILCSVATAEAAGVPRDRWVFPLAGADAHDTYAVSERRDLHSSPAIAACGEALKTEAGIDPADADHIDLYSCFPSAVQIGATELGIGLDRRLTLTGGLPLAGGPLNNYVSHSVVSMVECLREHPGDLGLVSANGGYTTKHALGLYSTEPREGGFVSIDAQPAASAVEKRPVDETHTGPVVIEGYTVMHDREGPTVALAALLTPTGARTWGSSTDPSLMASLMTDEGIGRAALLDADGRFSLVEPD